jgi:hypothetical protein
VEGSFDETERHLNTSYVIFYPLEFRNRVFASQLRSRGWLDRRGATPTPPLASAPSNHHLGYRWRSSLVDTANGEFIRPGVVALIAEPTPAALLEAVAKVRKKARPRLKLGIRLILTFFDSAQLAISRSQLF